MAIRDDTAPIIIPMLSWVVKIIQKFLAKYSFENLMSKSPKLLASNALDETANKLPHKVSEIIAETMP